MARKTIDKRGWTVEGSANVDLEKLVDLYRASSRADGDDRALTVTAEAIASESTALSNPAAEASAFIAAKAVRNLAKGAK